MNHGNTSIITLLPSQRNILKFAAQSDKLSLHNKAHVLAILLTHEGLSNEQISAELNLDETSVRDQQNAFMHDPKGYILEVFTKDSLLSAVSYLLAAA